MSKTIDDLLKHREEQESETIEQSPIDWRDLPALGIFFILFFVVLLQFVSRYVFNDSIAWTEEASRYLLILLAFFGAIKCQILGSHIQLEFIDTLFPKFSAVLNYIGHVLTMMFFGVLLWAVYVLAERTSFQKMVSLPYPKYYLYALIIIAVMGLLIVQAIQLHNKNKESKS